MNKTQSLITCNIPDVYGMMKKKDPGKSDKFSSEMTVKMPTLRLRRCFISGSDFKNSYYNHVPRSNRIEL